MTGLLRQAQDDSLHSTGVYRIGNIGVGYIKIFIQNALQIPLPQRYISIKNLIKANFLSDYFTNHLPKPDNVSKGRGNSAEALSLGEKAYGKDECYS